MSIRWMSHVWEAGPRDGIQRAILVALADHASDDGHAFPSVPHLVEKTQFSRSTVKRVLDILEAEGWFTCVPGVGRGNKTVYQLNWTPKPTKRVATRPFSEEAEKGSPPDDKRVLWDNKKGSVGTKKTVPLIKFLTTNESSGKLKENPYGVKESAKPPLVGEPAFCEPPPATLPSTPRSIDPENNPEVHEAATVAALAAPFFRSKPKVQATAITASHRREVYAAARWEIKNNPAGNPTLGVALENLRKLFERHERGSPVEFDRYRDKPLKFYLADKPYHNAPRKPLALVKPTKFLNEIRRDELAGKVAR